MPPRAAACPSRPPHTVARACIADDCSNDLLQLYKGRREPMQAWPQQSPSARNAQPPIASPSFFRSCT
jgi:hypothetical protein